MSGPNAVSSHSDLSSKFGYLFKRGEKNTELKKRFFQLRSKDMNYYKSHEDDIGTVCIVAHHDLMKTVCLSVFCATRPV